MSIKFVRDNFYLIILLLFGGILRLLYLGYSNYQGDEIKALFLPDQDQTISNFLLTQRKGPIQFLVTYVLRFINPTYDNELLIRLPFAIAGVLAIYYFYKLIKHHFNDKIAFYSTFFFVTNGFFIAFSRIVQYQSFVILFMVAALYAFSLRRNYLGFVLWVLSVLSHYDGVLILPFVAYLLYLQVPSVDKRKFIAKEVVIGIGIFLGLLCIFYIPFILNIDPATKSYWLGRITTAGGKISNSRYLFSVYQPIYVTHIYTLLFALGIAKVISDILGSRLLKDIVLVKKPLKQLVNSVRVALQSDRFFKYTALSLWFLMAFIFLEIAVSIPGTHIYTYLVPAFVFLGLGVTLIEDLVALAIPRYHKVLASIGVFFVFTFIYLQSYAIFVDHTREYPWEIEKFLVWEFAKPSPTFHLSLFGFPYYRDWDSIGEFVQNGDYRLPCPKNGYAPHCATLSVNSGTRIPFYSTNERDSITRHYVPFKKETNFAGYYVYIYNPQSFTEKPSNEKIVYWRKNYAPVKTFYTGDRPMAEIFYMPQGGVDAIRLLGY